MAGGNGHGLIELRGDFGFVTAAAKVDKGRIAQNCQIAKCRGDLGIVLVVLPPNRIVKVNEASSDLAMIGHEECSASCLIGNRSHRVVCHIWIRSSHNGL